MKILIINCGSSSLKFQLMDTKTLQILAKGNCERIGVGQSFINYKSDKCAKKLDIEMQTHTDAIKNAMNLLVDEECGVLKSLNEIDAIGHRMVHGGEKFTQSVVVTEELLTELTNLIPLAPLHNPANILGIRACMEVLPDKQNVVVFDTAFHATMPDYAYMYGLGYDMYQLHKIRKYGFHGSSHRYIAMQMEKIYSGLKGKKIISCHLGNGSSITAIKDGKSMDTTMGYTPLAGVIMGTRCGDIDPALVKSIMDYTGKNVQQVMDYLNKQCGLLGISGISSDMRDIEANIDKPRVKLAFNMLCHSIKKYIGAYAAIMGGVDAIVFTGGIGENTVRLRQQVLEGLEFMGVKLDSNKNENLPRGTSELISTKDSKVEVYRIPTDEEYIIAMDTERLVK